MRARLQHESSVQHLRVCCVRVRHPRFYLLTRFCDTTAGDATATATINVAAYSTTIAVVAAVTSRHHRHRTDAGHSSRAGQRVSAHRLVTTSKARAMTIIFCRELVHTSACNL